MPKEVIYLAILLLVAFGLSVIILQLTGTGGSVAKDFDVPAEPPASSSGPPAEVTAEPIIGPKSDRTRYPSLRSAELAINPEPVPEWTTYQFSVLKISYPKGWESSIADTHSRTVLSLTPPEAKGSRAHGIITVTDIRVSSDKTVQELLDRQLYTRRQSQQLPYLSTDAQVYETSRRLPERVYVIRPGWQADRTFLVRFLRYDNFSDAFMTEFVRRIDIHGFGGS